MLTRTTCLPKLGEWVAGDRDSYRYLAESIAVHPDQQTLREMMRAAGVFFLPVLQSQWRGCGDSPWHTA